MKENDVICTNNVRYNLYSKLLVTIIHKKSSFKSTYNRHLGPTTDLKKRKDVLKELHVVKIYGHFAYDYVSINLIA